MQATIITLLVIGTILFIATFFMNRKTNEVSDSKETSVKAALSEEEKQSFLENASIEIVEMTQDKIEGAKDELEKISNEKLMAVGEFSDTVLGEMDKTHKEIMFLYNMLNEKEAEIKKLMQEKNNQAKLSKEEMDHLEDISINQLQSNVAKENVTTFHTRSEEEGKTSKDNTAEEVSHRSKRRSSKRNLTSAKNENSSQSRNRFPNENHFQDDNSQDDNSLRNKSELKDNTKPKNENSLTNNANSKNETKQKNNNSEIISLYQNGVSVVEIAKRLNLGKGEVKLVIDLFSQEKEQRM